MKSYHDISGDGGSGVVAQVGRQKAGVAERLSAVRHLVAVGSGKGGVGKSTLTFHLAAALARDGARVTVLDADLNGPTQARLSGLATAPLVPLPGGLGVPRDERGIGVVSLGALVPETEAVDFPSVADGDTHVWRATREFTFLGQLLGSVDWGAQDFLLVDLPPGAERTFQYAEFFGPSAAFVLVSLPSELSRGVVSRSLAALRRTPNRILGIIENMSGYYCEDCEQVRPLFPEGDSGGLDLPLLGRVPFDPVLAAACDRGDVLSERTDRPALRTIRAAARRIVETLEANP